MKPGFATSEFWASVGAEVLAFLGLFHPGINLQAWTPIVQSASVLAGAITAGIYSHGRAKVKTAVAQNPGSSVRP